MTEHRSVLLLHMLADAGGWMVTPGAKDGMFVVDVGHQTRIYGTAAGLVAELEARQRRAKAS